MRNDEKIEIPLVNIERNPMVVAISVLISGIIVFWAYTLLVKVNPWGFMVMVPGAFISFQSLWFLLNPFALIFKERIEFKQSLFNTKIRYYIDIKKITETKSGKLYITYNDDEVEALNVFGIKNTQVALLKSELEKFIQNSIAERL